MLFMVKINKDKVGGNFVNNMGPNVSDTANFFSIQKNIKNYDCLF